MRRDIRNEYNKVIGWAEDYGTKIDYCTYKCGLVGSYYKDTKVYRRWKQIPGKPTITFPNAGDYGEQDVRYWGD